MLPRKKTRPVLVRNVTIGNKAPVVIQSMTNVKTTDVDAAVAQIDHLAGAGCRIVRLAIPDRAAANAFKRIRERTDTPLVADIHFDYRLACAAIEAGADKIRINPGNIGGRDRVRAVVDAARSHRIPIRIGVNSGSLEKKLLETFGGPAPQALLESALGYIRMMESFRFHDIVVSIKASCVPATVSACRLLARRTDVPQHIGITESGTVRTGTIRSAVGIGALLAEGIGDTIRVSLSGDPVQEIFVAREILKSLDLAPGPVVIACPTCGRTEIDVAELAAKVESMVAGIEAPLTIAVMGCVVNGPGEAREADIGIAGGKHESLIMVRGKPLKKVPEAALLEVFNRELARLLERKNPHGPSADR
ncbi:MAG: flavodoxin-dependent (E)-4-hydroxy-3-methylbut-2-enyl-diphosphate synthase [Chitinispirillaceae bacterium]|nr:flavodoxin-dependent (E)-4-hydroxy-3-methylbut-2-enyl-diphosphate synthase [Chitinispirillaceae bacterium]